MHRHNPIATANKISKAFSNMIILKRFCVAMDVLFQSKLTLTLQIQLFLKFKPLRRNPNVSLMSYILYKTCQDT